jgi:hypothetical protein
MTYAPFGVKFKQIPHGINEVGKVIKVIPLSIHTVSFLLISPELPHKPYYKTISITHSPLYCAAFFMYSCQIKPKIEVKCTVLHNLRR